MLYVDLNFTTNYFKLNYIDIYLLVIPIFLFYFINVYINIFIP